MKMFFGLIVILLVATNSVAALAETDVMLLEKIKLQHKPAGDIIPLVEPFLPENAVISGEGYIIILRTTAENMPQVKQLITDLDTPLQQFQISVSLDPAVLQQATIESAPSAEESDEDHTATPPTSQADTTQIYKTKGHKVAAGIQVIQVLQDRWSMIRTGQAIPVIKRIRNPDGTITESVSYQQVNQGLRIRPHLTGEEVILSIQPFYEAASQSGTGQQLYYKQEKQTKARLGNWLRIDTITGSLIQSEGSKIQQESTSVRSTSLIYLKVDIVP
jgi:hypothetical protein